MPASDVQIPTVDGMAAGYLCAPDGNVRAGVILCMDANGLRPTLREMGERLAAEGYLVLIPDLFYRWAPYGPFDPKAVSSNPEILKQVGRLNRSFTAELFERDAAAYVDYLTKAGAPATLAAVGYCMGGRCALALAGHHPERIALAASFHGGELATTRPGSVHLLAPRMRAKVYLGVAAKDAYFGADEEGRLAAALRDAGVVHTIETYEGTEHGFTIRDVPTYDADGADLHFKRLFALLDKAQRESTND